MLDRGWFPLLHLLHLLQSAPPFTRGGSAGKSGAAGCCRGLPGFQVDAPLCSLANGGSTTCLVLWRHSRAHHVPSFPSLAFLSLPIPSHSFSRSSGEIFKLLESVTLFSRSLLVWSSIFTLFFFLNKYCKKYVLLDNRLWFRRWSHSDRLENIKNSLYFVKSLIGIYEWIIVLLIRIKNPNFRRFARSDLWMNYCVSILIDIMYSIITNSLHFLRS